MDYLERARFITPYMSEIRQQIHMFPEVGTNLPHTIKLVTDSLSEIGCKFEIVENGGIVAVINGNSSGPAFMLRADMDALPIVEKSNEVFSSKNANMHACGHDMHTAMLLGATRLLKEDENNLRGQVKIVFQMDEEGSTGMKTLIQNNILESPKVNAAMALHVYPGELVAGKFFCVPGCINLGMNTFKIKIIGKGAHGAMPYKGIDPINIVSHICIFLQQIIANEIPGTEPVAISNGFVHAGSAANVIPDEAIIGGSIRSTNPERASMLMSRIRTISTDIASMYGARCEIDFPADAPACINDKDVVSIVKESAKEINLEAETRDIMMVSEDFGIVTQNVPSAFVWLGAGGEGKFADGILHGDRTCFNECALPYGAALLASSAVRWLNQNS